MSYRESSGRRGIVQLSAGVRYLAVAMMDQTRRNRALQSNAVHVAAMIFIWNDRFAPIVLKKSAN